LPSSALVARPAEVLDRPGSRGVDAIDLLPRAPADIPDPCLAGARPDSEAERVAQPVGDDPARVLIAAAGQRVIGEPSAGVGTDANERPAEADRVARRAQVLGAQGAAFSRRPRLNPAHAGRRVAARVDGGDLGIADHIAVANLSIIARAGVGAL